MPLGIVCSAQATRPMPPISSSAPTIRVSARARRLGRWIVRRLRRATTPASRIPAGTNRMKPITNGGTVSTATLMPRYVEPHTR